MRSFVISASRRILMLWTYTISKCGRPILKSTYKRGAAFAFAGRARTCVVPVLFSSSSIFRCFSHAFAKFFSFGSVLSYGTASSANDMSSIRIGHTLLLRIVLAWAPFVNMGRHALWIRLLFAYEGVIFLGDCLQRCLCNDLHVMFEIRKLANSVLYLQVTQPCPPQSRFRAQDRRLLIDIM